MKIFITGGTGCVGQYVTALSAKKEHETVVLSQNPDKYKPFSEMENITLVKGQITDYKLIREYVKGVDAVIHIALGWGDTPALMLANDTAATVNLLEIAEEAGVQKFVYTSSTAAFGNNLPGINETFQTMPTDLYGGTKAASEAFVIGFRKYYGDKGEIKMKRNIIRPGYTFANPLYPGATVQKDARFRDISDNVVNNKPIHLTKHDGTQFLSSEQIANVYMAIIESGLNEEIFLALSKNFTTWETIAKMALEEYPASSSEIVLEDKGWGVQPNLYSVEKIKKFFGLEYDGTDEIRKHVRFNLEMSEKNKYLV